MKIDRKERRANPIHGPFPYNKTKGLKKGKANHRNYIKEKGGEHPIPVVQLILELILFLFSVMRPDDYIFMLTDHGASLVVCVHCDITTLGQFEDFLLAQFLAALVTIFQTFNNRLGRLLR